MSEEKERANRASQRVVLTISVDSKNQLKINHPPDIRMTVNLLTSALNIVVKQNLKEPEASNIIMPKKGTHLVG